MLLNALEEPERDAFVEAYSAMQDADSATSTSFLMMHAIEAAVDDTIKLHLQMERLGERRIWELFIGGRPVASWKQIGVPGKWES